MIQIPSGWIIFQMVVFDVCTGTARWNSMMMVASIIALMSQVVAIKNSCCTYAWAVLMYGHIFKRNVRQIQTTMILLNFKTTCNSKQKQKQKKKSSKHPKNNIPCCILVDPAYTCLYDGKCNPNSKICDCSKFNAINLTNYCNNKKHTATCCNCVVATVLLISLTRFVLHSHLRLF